VEVNLREEPKEENDQGLSGNPPLPMLTELLMDDLMEEEKKNENPVWIMQKFLLEVFGVPKCGKQKVLISSQVFLQPQS